MSEFDKVIGYQAIKEELVQICDMVRNPQIYRNLGAKLPRGILLDGDPGLGKTLMAECFIKESGLKSYTLRRDTSAYDFMDKIRETFKNAKEYNGPVIIFLDDMDKFANEDSSRCNAEEYVAVQSGIDETRGSEVLVIATSNDCTKLPSSLIRPGRFDRVINVEAPSETEAEKIITHYLANKKVSETVILEDIPKMMSYSSCADLETMLNEAAILAGFARHDSIETDDLIGAVLKTEYKAIQNDYVESDEDRTIHAMHEAGHLVVSEVLWPGSIGLASIKLSGGNEIGGFVHQCKDYPSQEYTIMVALGGRAAVEMHCAEKCAKGCKSDMEKAAQLIRNRLTKEGMLGIGMVNVSGARFSEPSESFNSRLEAVTQAELERYMMKTRDILIRNRDFLESVARELAEKNTLLYSDIRRVRENANTAEERTANGSN